MKRMQERIFIYGAGKIGGQVASMALETGREIVAWMDANPSHAGKERCGARIYGLDDFPDNHVSRRCSKCIYGYPSVAHGAGNRGRPHRALWDVPA